MKQSLVFPALLACLTSLSFADGIRFIPATPENTMLADGSPLPMEGGAWMWHQEEGNRGFFETTPGTKSDGAGMMIRATDLDPGRNYEVFGLFRVDGIPLEGMSERRHGAVRFGLSLATLQAFDGHRPDDLVAREPWVITPGYETGKSFGYQVVMEHEEPLEGLEGLFVGSAKPRLARARLGCTMTDRNGVLPVFFAMQTGTRTVCGSAVEGIALRPAPLEEPLMSALTPSSRLHLAIRAGDVVTMQREFEAGADVNAFDEEGLTPLFHAVASGDAAMVRALLAHGAEPDCPNQSVSPLAAAAMIAEPDTVRLLLSAGATVPLQVPENHGKQAIPSDPRYLHPIVAAIRSGSLPVLKQLLKATPDFHLLKFNEGLQELEAKNPKRRRFMFVHDAMVKMDWEMAAYLIDNGFPITRRVHDPKTDRKLLMLADAVHAGAMAMPVVDAMLRRGVPAVDRSEKYSCDALTVATMRGNTDLVRRFLPAARDLGPDYRNWLLDNALCSENEEIISMVRSAFPEARVERGQPEVRNDAVSSLADTDQRLFLPRTTPPPASEKNPEKGRHVLAVVAAPDAAAAGDVLAAYASRQDGWKVVDREQVEAALQENRFSKPWLDGEHRLSELGDRLHADCMIVVSSIRAGGDSISRFEVVEVTTGLEVHREHFKTSVFVDEKEIAAFLNRAAAALDAAGRFVRHRTITLLSFSTQGRLDKSLATSELLRAAVQHEVDSTPGLISLSRAQSARLIEEKALDGSGSVWGATHMLEGVLSAEEGSRIKVSLRLETYQDGVTTETDAEALGDATAIAETAASAWRKLLAHPGNPVPDADPGPHDPERAMNEGRRLMREAEWLHSMNANPGIYLPLIESAIALGVPADETILLHLDGCFQSLRGALHMQAGHSMNDGTITSALQEINSIFYTRSQLTSIRSSDKLAEELPAARRLLHQTSWYLERLGADALDGGTNIRKSYKAYKSNEIWFAIQALCHIRARIHPSQIRQELVPDFNKFAEELDSLTQRYFMLLRTVPNPDPYRYYLQSADFLLYRRNPALVEGLASMAGTGASLNALLHVSPYTIPDITQASDNRQFQWMESRQELARKMIRCIGENPSDTMKVAKADLECFVAGSDGRNLAVKRLVDAFARTKWRSTPTREIAGQHLLSDVIISARTTSDLFGEYLGWCTLTHDRSLLPSILFSSVTAPDLLARFECYHIAFHVINQCEAWQQDRESSDIDPFRKSISAYYPKELRRLERASVNNRPVNALPPQTSIYNGPPQIRTNKSSAALLSLIEGAGKIPSAAVDPARRMEGEPVHEKLQAVLLADLRIDGAPGTLNWPLVDKADPTRLWLFSFPSTGDSIPVRMGEHQTDGVPHECREPWLLSVDCDDGTVATKVNLHDAVRQAYGIDIPARTCEIWPMVMDQTMDRILTRVVWLSGLEDTWNHNNCEYGSVLIDKADGRAHPVPGNPHLKYPTLDLGMNLWGWPTGLVAIDDHFYYLDKNSAWSGVSEHMVISDRHSVFVLAPDLSVKPLTMRGRKPEKTPFDAMDRTPIGITPHDGRLMVFHPSTIAEYDPVEDEWSIIAASPARNPSPKDTHPVADAQFWEYLKSIHEIRVAGESTGWFAVGWQHPPGVLPFASRTKGIRNIGINASIPEDFMNNTVGLHQIYPDGVEKLIRTPLKNHPQFQKADMVVLAQTDTDLILGMTNGDPFEWAYPSCDNQHLPFLWKVSKKEILDLLGDGK
jgi:hypothetical protein